MLASYGLAGLLSLALDVVRTLPDSRLVLRPLSIRGKQWIALGPRFTCGHGLRMDDFGDCSTTSRLIRIGFDAVGSSARVVKEFNFATGMWEQV
jgi:hypothetical protein